MNTDDCMGAVNASHENTLSVACIGFGEAAGAFVSGWNGAVPVSVKAYDIKTDGGRAAREQKLQDYVAAHVEGCPTPHEATQRADAVFSLVTADQALDAARSVAGGLEPQAFYFDCNSCAPNTKRQAEAVIKDAGGRYIDVAVMAPVHPPLHRVPLLVSGDDATAALETLAALDMRASEVSGGVGAASAIKLVRSIMMKGLEALMAECVLAGRALGVEGVVLDTLEKTYPGFGWPDRATYMLERATVHGERRAVEMREAAAMVGGLGLPSRMARAAVDWQQQLGDLSIDPGDDDYAAQADRILRRLSNSEETRDD